MVMKERCLIKRCRNKDNIIYLGNPICELHWNRHCNENDSFDLRKELDIKEEEKNV